MPSKEVANRNKICIVPECKTVSADLPDRIFFAVPEHKKKEWLEKVGGDVTSIKPNKRLFCCENHFDVKRDIEGYDFYKHFGGRIKLVENAYPSKCLGDNTNIDNAEEELFNESVDPLSLSDDRSVEEECCDESSNIEDYNLVPAAKWNVNESRFDSTQIARSEEIVVTSDVYVNDYENGGNEDDVPLKIKKESDAKPFLNPKKELFEGDQVDGGTKYNCQHCNKILSSSKSLKRHIKSIHSENLEDDKELLCKKCHKVFSTRKEYKKHKLIHNLIEHNCEKCGKKLSSARSLRRHVQSFHKVDVDGSRSQTGIKCEQLTDDESDDKEISCKECSQIFCARDDYLKHKIIHKKTFECDVCQKVFRTRLHLKVHFPSHMKIKPFLCEICSRAFARANNFRRHKLTHVTDKKFVCDACGRRFPANYLLKQHKSHHHNESNPRRIKNKATSDCDDCRITLNSPYRLKLHRLKLHNPANPFTCSTCKQTFATEILMNQHTMRTHAPEHEYIFKCYICPKKYNQEAALKRHVKLHTDAKKPVACPFCEKILGRPNRLKPHMRALHNPNYTFKCSICSQTFKEQKILDNHTTQVHEQTILCQFCNKSYSNQRGLQQHIRKFHSSLTPDRNE